MGDNQEFAEAVEALFRGEEHSNVVEYFYSDPAYEGDVVNGVQLWHDFVNNGKYYVLDHEVELIQAGVEFLKTGIDHVKRVIDFGCGTEEATAKKVVPVLDQHPHAEYHPIDLSAEFLRSAEKTVRRLAPGHDVYPHRCDFTDKKKAKPKPVKAMGLFFGNTIANVSGHFNAKAPRDQVVDTLTGLGNWLNDGDRLVVTYDSNTDKDSLMDCYASKEGKRLTENLMYRIQRDLIDDEGFKPEAWEFEPVAVKREFGFIFANTLVATEEQSFEFNGQDYFFPKGHRLIVANSNKYSEEFFNECAEDAGYEIGDTIKDPDNTMVMQVLSKGRQPK